ncbi:SUMF1/EgtB/PvdO family nonheme iron enzyme [Corallococcus sp. bb12-1]|uniref:formylglycine-generating enzyme family protein n=1 Tax=Corallococcus sp. bb12-1 TaxID=2996784 RepID=UPI0022703E7C|nr:SUMF1/EgtB/PvdO family nonheme iron enzyme [Corallococcus sp. bb12-1]MCY1039750.1 SUMF1/EgtB/PvdO family nonheme iron enzyme [Corallococcus sp. bb12-1]
MAAEATTSLTQEAWYYDNSDATVHPVGKKKPNAYGLHDMLGNVWEWTWDADEYNSKLFDGEMNDPFTGRLDVVARRNRSSGVRRTRSG